MRLKGIWLALAICALTGAVLVAVWNQGPGGAVADDTGSPAAGLDLSIGVDAYGGSADDCDTDGGPTECLGIPIGETFRVSVYLNSLPDKATTYEGLDIVLGYDGVASLDNADIDSYWPACVFPALFYEPGRAAFGCAYFPEETEPSSYTGRIATIDFTCDEPGHVVLRGGQGNTDIVSGFVVYAEGGDETLDVSCGSVAPTPTTPSVRVGDANCDGIVNPVDAALILQHIVGRLSALPCETASDVNGDAVINPLDSLLILQFAAGLIHTLPP